MSDVITQKCAGCGALKPLPPDPVAAQWTRIFGVAPGNANRPIVNINPALLQRGQPFSANPALDFCPACAANMTVNQLAELCLKKN